MRKPGHLAVQAVHEGGDKYGHAGILKTALPGPDHGQKTQKHAERGEHVGQKIKTLARLFRVFHIKPCGPEQSGRRRHFHRFLWREYSPPANKGQHGCRSESGQSALPSPGCRPPGRGRQCAWQPGLLSAPCTTFRHPVRQAGWRSARCPSRPCPGRH